MFRMLLLCSTGLLGPKIAVGPIGQTNNLGLPNQHIFVATNHLVDNLYRCILRFLFPFQIIRYSFSLRLGLGLGLALNLAQALAKRRLIVRSHCVAVVEI